MNGACVLLLLLVNNAYHSNGQADPPEYTHFWDRLMNVSRIQTEQYIRDMLVLPEVSSNPSIVPWIWDKKYDTDPEHSNMLISWCGSSYACPYQVMSIGVDKTDWKVTKSRDNFEVFAEHGGKSRWPLLVGDIRLYMVENTVRLTYVAIEGNLQTYHYAQVFYDRGLDALYVLQNHVYKMSISHEVGVRSQKNWSPFVYDFSNNPRVKQLSSSSHFSSSEPIRRNGTENLFAYSINPHRIVHGNETAEHGVVKMHTVSSSEVILQPGEQFWKWGEARGGTPSILIDTVHGPRFVSLFHSQCRCAVSYILTYYFGAYLFNPEPPFEITHMTPDPIIPKEMYSENNGWAFKAIDYIVFPTGLFQRDGHLFATMGRNDKAGWALVMETAGFVASMVPVRTKVLQNSFFKHVAYSVVEQKIDLSAGSSVGVNRHANRHATAATTGATAATAASNVTRIDKESNRKSKK